jgi:hypothetical protein
LNSSVSLVGKELVHLCEWNHDPSPITNGTDFAGFHIGPNTVDPRANGLGELGGTEDFGCDDWHEIYTSTDIVDVERFPRFVTD